MPFWHAPRSAERIVCPSHYPRDQVDDRPLRAPLCLCSARACSRDDLSFAYKKKEKVGRANSTAAKTTVNYVHDSLSLSAPDKGADARIRGRLLYELLAIISRSCQTSRSFFSFGREEEQVPLSLACLASGEEDLPPLLTRSHTCFDF
ncbi:hypothetical protein CEXT_786891 [Caerostris extrusa]|uniref:Uncharacterized protein n=1 Tax=Caerostris extrusa TaxID=172846 RepID=A0AAV4YC47_CAEEX|nr:hypothetical protein CEXT_786891 [Caerostris extrusa]